MLALRATPFASTAVVAVIAPSPPCGRGLHRGVSKLYRVRGFVLPLTQVRLFLYRVALSREGRGHHENHRICGAAVRIVRECSTNLAENE